MIKGKGKERGNIEYLAWPSPLGEQGMSNDEVINGRTAGILVRIEDWPIKNAETLIKTVKFR